MILEKNEAAWVPLGAFAIVNGAHDLSCYTSVPWVADPLKEAVEKEPWDVMSVYTLAFLRKFGDTAPCSSCGAELKQYSKARD